MSSTLVAPRTTGLDKTGGRWFLMCNSLETGGIERQFNILAKALQTDHQEVLLGCLNREGAFLEGIGEVSAFPTGGSFFSIANLKNRWRLARFLRSQRVMVAHSFDFYSNIMLAPTAKLARVPAVIACQNQFGDLLTPNQNRAELANFRICDRVVCNSRAAADRLEKLGISRRKLIVIPNGIVDDVFHPAKPLLEPVSGQLRIGVVARMNHWVKNQEGFLRAAALVAKKHRNVEFVLSGDGPLRPGFELLAAEGGIGSRVRFLGDRRDVAEVLASLDIAVVPSFSESLSNSLLEAMAAGKAVIATAVGGTPEVVFDGDTGLLVPKGDNEAMARAMERFIESPDLRRTCGLNAQRLAREYTYDKLRDRHKILYRELLAEKLGQEWEARTGVAP